MAKGVILISYVGTLIIVEEIYTRYQIERWRNLDFYYTQKIDKKTRDCENIETKAPTYYDIMILEILRTRTITPPSYK